MNTNQNCLAITSTSSRIEVIRHIEDMLVNIDSHQRKMIMDEITRWEIEARDYKNNVQNQKIRYQKDAFKLKDRDNEIKALNREIEHLNEKLKK